MMTNRILVAYATRHGQSRKIAGHLARELTAWGHTVEMVDVARTPAVDWDDYDAAILVASVHAGRHEKEMIAFARRGRAALDQMANAFLSVTLTEATVEDGSAAGARRQEAAAAVQKVVEAFVKDTGWHPKQVVPVAGALLYRQYNLFIRVIMKQITKKNQGPADTSRDYEYTAWTALSHFASTFSRHIGRPPKIA